MKLLMRIVAVIAILAALVWDIYDWIYIDQGHAYFAADWRRIALVIFLSLSGGLIAFLFMKLSAIVRQRLITNIFGTGILLATICCAYFLWALFKLRVFLAGSKELWIVLSIVLGSIAMTAFAWFLFLKYWRRISRQKDAA